MALGRGYRAAYIGRGVQGEPSDQIDLKNGVDAS
jgi:hypothetical protein